MVRGLRDLCLPNFMAQGLYHLIAIQMVKKFPDSVKCIDMDLYGITTEICIEFAVFVASLLCIEIDGKEDTCPLGCDTLYFCRQV